ncbi:A-agglutinin anchorage subunit-like isoform X1 [Haliotis rufescens]|uniref:A-agglutinin anchorage subunit-like isoform X1 n=1 Tax=Haliotis rufescens TaxID=6454 RepID=UPI00201E8214|nr:A-agglutinin anchorage subunit-like isoform X1 [Haliotis rufescens]
MTSTESLTDPTDLRTLSDADSDDASGGCVRRQSSTYIYVVDMTVSGQPLPDVVSENNRDEEPEDHYDKIGSLQRHNMGYTKSRSGTLTSEDMASGQSVAPYFAVRHLQQSVVPPQDPRTRQWCSWKRCVLVGLVVTVTIVLLSGLITVAALLLSRQAEQTRGDVTLPTSQPILTASATTDVSTISTSTTTEISNSTSTASTTTQSSFSSTTTTPATSEEQTLPTSQPILTASATTDGSTISTSTTTEISNSTSTASTTTQSSFSSTTTTPATSEEQTRGDVTLPTSQPTFTASATTDVSTISTSTTTEISNLTSTASTTTQSSFSSTTTTPATSEGCIRKCISCTSHNTRCPANGMIVEGDPGEVIDCPCNTACYSDIRYDDGSSVHRGCTGDYPAWDAASSVNLTCREIDRHFLCFCLGDRCNKEDMTSHIS